MIDAGAVIDFAIRVIVGAVSVVVVLVVGFLACAVADALKGRKS